MLKPNKLCKVCAAIKKDKRLLEEIFNSKYFMKTSGPPLTAVASKYPDLFNYDNLKNHVRKHQFMSEEDYTARHTERIVKKAEKKIIQRNIEAKEVWDSVISYGMDKLKEGTMDIKTADLLKAAKDKSDFALKKQDQQLATIEMVMFFASGENNLEDRNKYDRRFVENKAVTDFDPAEELADDTNRREEQSRSFYQSLAGDSTPPGSD